MRLAQGLSIKDQVKAATLELLSKRDEEGHYEINVTILGCIGLESTGGCENWDEETSKIVDGAKVDVGHTSGVLSTSEVVKMKRSLVYEV